MQERIAARVTQVSRGSLHDGPGSRTVVYLKGCSLACLWCHNPETIGAGDEVSFLGTRCIGCGRCADACPNGCHSFAGGAHVFDRSRCTLCLACCRACPSEALASVARDMTVEEVFLEIARDRHFYAATGGGVTLSGGECLLRPAFAAALLGRCRAEGIHTAVETALHVPLADLLAVVPVTDLFLVDLKILDPAEHRRLTGSGNERILDNLAHLAAIHDRIRVRIPLVPGMTDQDGNLEGIARWIGTMGRGIGRIELLRYNDLAGAKYAALGRSMPSPGLPPQTDLEMERFAERIRKAAPEGIEVGYP